MSNEKTPPKPTPELSNLVQEILKRAVDNPSVGSLPHPPIIPTGILTGLSVPEGGFKVGEMSMIMAHVKPPYKSDITGYLYRQKVARSWELKDFIAKGEGTAVEMNEAQHELDVLTEQLEKFDSRVRHVDPAAYVSPLPDKFDIVYDPEMPYMSIVPPGEGMPFDPNEHQKEVILMLDGGRQPGKQTILKKLMEMTPIDIMHAARRKPMMMEAMIHAALLPLKIEDEAHHPVGKKKADWKPNISWGKPVKDEPKKKQQPSGLLSKLVGRIKE